MGTLYKSGKKGIYAMRYYDRNGKQRDESTHTTNRDTADRLLKDREHAIAKGGAVTPKVGQFRFDALTKLVITDYTVNEYDSTALTTSRVKNHLEPYFGSRRAASIKTSDLKDYVAHRKAQGAKNATICRELAIVRRGFKLAMQDGTLLNMPHIPMPDESKNKRSGFFERAAFDAIRDHLPEDYDPIAIVAYYTGWRVSSEVLCLEKRHIDRPSQTIRLDPQLSKNDEGRVFPYGVIPELAQAIDRVFEQHEALKKQGIISPWLFVRWAPGQRGGSGLGTRIKSIRGAWEKARVASGQPGRFVHDFRRTAVRNLENVGVPRSRAMAAVGHKTESIYRRYAIVNEADLAESLSMLAPKAPRKAIER